VAPTLAVVGGNDQEGPPGTALPLPVTVVLKGADGNPLAGKQLTVGATAGLVNGSFTTDSLGMVSVSWSLGTAIVPHRLDFRADLEGGVVLVTSATARVVNLQVRVQEVASSSFVVAGHVYLPAPNTIAWIEWGTDSTFATYSRSPQSVVPPDVAFRINSPTIGTTYYFRLAVQVGDSSVQHSEVGSFGFAAPSAPSLVATYDPSEFLIDYVLQHDGTGIPSSYLLEMREVGDSVWHSAAQDDVRCPCTISRSLATDISRAQTIEIRARFFNAVGYGPAATAVVTTSMLRGPDNLAAATPDSGHVILTWREYSAGKATASIERREPDGEFIVVGETPVNQTVFIDQNAAPGVTFTYRVREKLDSRFSDYSNEVSIMPSGRVINPIGVQTSPPPVVTQGQPPPLALSGTVTPNGLNAQAWMEWSSDSTFSNPQRGPADYTWNLRATDRATVITTPILPRTNVTYYYRAVGRNLLGTVYGEVMVYRDP
jgi:hypothetical protein